MAWYCIVFLFNFFANFFLFLCCFFALQLLLTKGLLELKLAQEKGQLQEPAQKHQKLKTKIQLMFILQFY